MARAIHAAADNVYGFTIALRLLNHHQRKVKAAFTLLEPSCGYGGRMDMGFDRSRFGLDLSGEQGFGAPEWLALRARLGAQWLARRALLQATVGGEAASGSFNSPAAGALSAYKAATPSVNPTALGNGKPIGAIDDDTASAQPTGGRG